MFLFLFLCVLGVRFPMIIVCREQQDIGSLQGLQTSSTAHIFLFISLYLFVCVSLFRLMQAGEEFSGAKSESLEESVRRQSLNYFRSYHRSKLDELRMFLENEGWELCPVKPSFSILMLQVRACDGCFA